MGKCTYRDEHGKQCTRCGEYKVFADFPMNKNAKDGRYHLCKVCHVRLEKERRVKRRKSTPTVAKNNPFESGIKRCGACKEYKPISEFSPTPRAHGRTGLTTNCKACNAAYNLRRKNEVRGLPEDFKVTIPTPVPIGTVSVWSDGYAVIKLPEHHRATNNGWVKQHIVVAEEKYGIKITTDFSVHHKNGDRADNRPSNLELRVGQHGSHADVMDRLMILDESRNRAVELLRQHGWTVIPPSKSKPHAVNSDQGDLFGAA